MGTPYDKNNPLHALIIGPNGPIPQKYDPEANSGQGGMVPSTVDDVQKVTQIGSIVEVPRRKEVVMLSRAVRTESSSYIREVIPDGAKGLFLILNVHGITGTFAAEEGISLEYGFNTKENSYFNSGNINTQTIDYSAISNISQTVEVYPGLPDMTSTRNRRHNMLAIGRVTARIEIAGTFGTGEGIDCELKVVWLV